LTAEISDYTATKRNWYYIPVYTTIITGYLAVAGLLLTVNYN
jgi:hypothetical protein